MGRKVLEVRGWTPEKIKSLFNSEDKYKIGLRLYAVYQVSLGFPSRDLVTMYNTSFKQITNWVHRFETEGIEGLRDKKGRGRKSRLSEAQEEELKTTLLGSSPCDYGYNTATWTGPIVIAWVEKHFSVSYKKAQIYNILKKLGFTYQKSKGFYPEADQQKQADFKKTLKKST